MTKTILPMIALAVALLCWSFPAEARVRTFAMCSCEGSAPQGYTVEFMTGQELIQAGANAYDVDIREFYAILWDGATPLLVIRLENPGFIGPPSALDLQMHRRTYRGLDGSGRAWVIQP